MRAGLADQEPGDDDADEGAGKYLEGGVAEEFLEALFLHGLALEHGVEELVEDAGLAAGRPAHTLGVEHDDKGKHGGQAKYGRSEAFEQADRPGRGGDRGGVGTGHAAGAEEDTQVELALGEEQPDELDALRREPAQSRRP